MSYDRKICWKNSKFRFFVEFSNYIVTYGPPCATDFFILKFSYAKILKKKQTKTRFSIISHNRLKFSKSIWDTHNLSPLFKVLIFVMLLGSKTHESFRYLYTWNYLRPIVPLFVQAPLVWKTVSIFEGFFSIFI